MTIVYTMQRSRKATVICVYAAVATVGSSLWYEGQHWHGAVIVIAVVVVFVFGCRDWRCAE